jgi:hypothetical protein
VFKPRVTDGGLSLAKVESGSTSCAITAGIYSTAGVNITMVESFSPTFTLEGKGEEGGGKRKEGKGEGKGGEISYDYLLTPQDPAFITSDMFRTNAGNQNVGNAFSTVSYTASGRLLLYSHSHLII